MTEAFSKLFRSITDSSVWAEDNETRIVWITMLAMADASGYVGAAVPGLAQRARVSVEAVEIALAKFQDPDPYSRSQKDEGRRIRKVDRGWLIINYQDFRNGRDEEERRNYERERKRKQRARNRTKEPSDMSQNVPDKSGTVRDSPGQSRTCPACLPLSAQAEAEAEAEADAELQLGEGRYNSPTVSRLSPAPRAPPGKAPPWDPSRDRPEAERIARVKLHEALTHGTASGVPPPVPPKSPAGKPRRQLNPGELAGRMLVERWEQGEDLDAVIAELLADLESWARLADAGHVSADAWAANKLLTSTGARRLVQEVEGGGDPKIKIDVTRGSYQPSLDDDYGPTRTETFDE